MQVAHFLEADLQPWGAALAAALFPPEPQQPSAGAHGGGSAVQRKGTWEQLEELKPLGDAVQVVLANRPGLLREQLPLTPAEWHPAVIDTHAAAGPLELDSDDAIAWSDAMRSVPTECACTLHISDGKEEPTASALSAVAALPKLRALILDEPGFLSRTANVTAAALVAHASRFSALTRLELDFGNVFPYTATELTAALSSYPRLAHLRLPDRFTSGTATGVFAPLSRLTGLTFLHLGSSNGMDIDDAQALADSLRQLTRLKQLRLRESSIGAAAATTVLPSVALLTGLEVLDLVRNDFSSVGAEALERALRRLPRLTELRLGACLINAAGAAALASPLALLAALTMLDLEDNEIGEVGAHALAPALRPLTRLKELRLHRGAVGDNGAAALAPTLVLLTALEVLLLSSNSLSSAGVAALAPSLHHLTRLTNLHLGGNAMHAAGAQALAPPLALFTALEVLRLSCSSLESAGVAALAPALRHLTRLTNLHLGHAGAFEAAARET